MSLTIELSGRTVLVTGAAGGLGKAIAHGVAGAGATVIASDLAGAQLDATFAELVDGGASVHVLAADLSSPDQAQDLVSRAVELAGSLHGLVNCAGIQQTKPLAELTASDWARVIDINLSGVFYVTQSVANHMSAAGGGSIVTLASVAARSGRPNAAHYSAAKTALLSLTKSAATAYGPSVRCNAICPGIFLTPMWEQIVSQRDLEFGAGAGQAYLDEVLGRVPLNRAGAAAELANVVTFLLSDLSSYITGQAINVDGGLEMD